MGRSGVLFCNNTLRLALDLKRPVLLKDLTPEQGGGERFLDYFSVCLATLDIESRPKRRTGTVKLAAFAAVAGVKTLSAVKLLLSSQIHRANCICLVYYLLLGTESAL